MDRVNSDQRGTVSHKHAQSSALNGAQLEPSSHWRELAALGVLIAGLAVSFHPAHAGDDCYGLWYDRNLIFAEAGYCFKTPLARQIFADYPCWTSAPSLTRAQRAVVSEIKSMERRLNCRVNK